MLTETAAAATDAWLVMDYVGLVAFLLVTIFMALIALIAASDESMGARVLLVLAVPSVVLIGGWWTQLIPGWSVRDGSGAALRAVPRCDGGVWVAAASLYRSPDGTCDRPGRGERTPLTTVTDAVKVPGLGEQGAHTVAFTLGVDDSDVLVTGNAARVRKDGVATTYQVVRVGSSTWLVPTGQETSHAR